MSNVFKIIKPHRSLSSETSAEAVINCYGNVFSGRLLIESLGTAAKAAATNAEIK